MTQPNEKFDHNTRTSLEVCYSDVENGFRLVFQMAAGIDASIESVKAFTGLYIKYKDDILRIFSSKPEMERLTYLLRTTTVLVKKANTRNVRYNEKLCKLFVKNKGKKKLEGKSFDRYLDYSSRYMALAELVHVDLFNTIREMIDILGGEIPEFVELSSTYDIANYDGKAIQEDLEENARAEQVKAPEGEVTE